MQWFISNPDGSSKLSGAPYFIFFAVLAMVAAFVFSLVAKNYKDTAYLQTEPAN